MSHSPATIDKATRLLPPILGLVAGALDLPVDELVATWRDRFVVAPEAPAPVVEKSKRFRRPSKWTEGLLADLTRLAGTMHAKDLAKRLDVGESSLYAKAGELKVSLAFTGRWPGKPATKAAPTPPASAPVAPVTAPAPARVRPASPVIAQPGTVALCRLVNGLGRYLSKDGTRFTRRTDEAWEGTVDQAAVVRRRNPAFRHLKVVGGN